MKRQDARKKNVKKYTEINVCTANARSLELKIPSLVDLIKNAELSVVIVTETWMKRNEGRIIAK